MKRYLKTLAICFVATFGIMFSSCDKEPENNGNDDNNGQQTASIIGNWLADRVIQNPGEHQVDMTNWYSNFQLTFEEDGTLIVNDGINETAMQWTLDGDNLAFIQAPGVDPVTYIVQELTQTKLVMVHGTGTDYVTVWELHRN